MKLLVVECNPEDVWKNRRNAGILPYHKRFSVLLQRIGEHEVTCAFPSEEKQLPTKEQLKSFDGILFTGSVLNIYHSSSSAIEKQLKFAASCFASGVPIYGSCWGLQLAVTVAGGEVDLCANGREFAVAKDITLTKIGKACPFFQHKPHVFDAYCIHSDEVVSLPQNAEILAYNTHSKIQALQFYYDKSSFFGVQYHPEFIFDDIEKLADLLVKPLINEGLFQSINEKNSYIKCLKQSMHLNNINAHTLEIFNWLQTISPKTES